uniref:RRM domain-containing protein n=1 Tax=Ciona savignyi TaxID=51511 RepID=H2ZGC2_CIOSA
VGLREYFTKFGVVRDCTIKKDSKTERSRGFGFVLFQDTETVKKVLEAESHYLDGRKIDPKKAQAQRRDGKLFVGGINPDTDNEKVKEHFSQFGEIEEFERPVDRTTEKNRGFCFITFKKDGCIKLACAQRNQELDGSKVDVKEAQPQVPGGGRGGGFGGRSFGMRGGGGYGHQGGYGGGGDGVREGTEKGNGWRTPELLQTILTGMGAVGISTVPTRDIITTSAKW